MLRAMSTLPLARRERLALCDLALAVGEDAPTLCEGWDAKDLVVHLLVREYSPAGIGIVVPPLAKVTEWEMGRLARRDFGVLVERLRRRGPTPFSLPPVERLLNTLEYVVHHEDLRRAQPGWTARELEAADEDTLWRHLATTGRGLVRPAGVPVVLERTDTGATRTLRRGAQPVRVAGRPLELVLFLFGRTGVADVAVTGTDDGVARLLGTSLGI